MTRTAVVGRDIAHAPGDPRDWCLTLPTCDRLEAPGGARSLTASVLWAAVRQGVAVVAVRDAGGAWREHRPTALLFGRMARRVRAGLPGAAGRAWRRVLAVRLPVCGRAEGPVVMVIPSLVGNGAERQMVALVDGLVSRGWPVRVLVKHLRDRPGADALLPTLARRGVPVDVWTAPPPETLPALVGLERAAGGLPDVLAWDLLGLAGWLAVLKPRAVHGWLDATAVTAGAAAAALGVPCVVAGLRNRAPDTLGHPLAAALRPGLAALARHPAVTLTANARAVAEDHRRWAGIAAPVVIPNGVVMLPTEPSRPAGSPLVLGVFRLVPHKRPLLWLDAAARVRAARPDARFRLLGDGPMRGAVRDHAAALGLPVETPGWIPDVGPHLAEASVLLHVSSAEGLPNVILEAQAAGVPVVACAAGGVAEALAGAPVEPPTPDALAARVLALLTDAEAWTRARQAARAHVARFGVPAMVARHERVYDTPPRRGDEGRRHALVARLRPSGLARSATTLARLVLLGEAREVARRLLPRELRRKIQTKSRNREDRTRKGFQIYYCSRSKFSKDVNRDSVSLLFHPRSIMFWGGRKSRRITERRHCEERQRRSNPGQLYREHALDCFADVQGRRLAMTGLCEPLARNATFTAGTMCMRDHRSHGGGSVVGPPRLAWIGETLARDGAPLSLREVADGLVMAGHAVPAVGLAFLDGPLRADWTAAGWPVRIVDPGRPLTARHLDRFTGRLADALAEACADVVLVNGLRAFAGVEAAARAGLPCVWTIREPGPEALADLSGVLQARALAAFGRAARVVFVSHATLRAWGDHAPANRSEVIANAVPQRSDRFRMTDEVTSAAGTPCQGVGRHVQGRERESSPIHGGGREGTFTRPAISCPVRDSLHPSSAPQRAESGPEARTPPSLRAGVPGRRRSNPGLSHDIVALDCFVAPLLAMTRHVFRRSSPAFQAMATCDSGSPFRGGSPARTRREEKRGAWPSSRKDIVLMAAGALCPRKGPLDLIAALPLLPDDLQRRIRLVWAGRDVDGYGRRVRQAVGRLPEPVRGRVHLLGACADMAVLWAAADVAVCSSHAEAAPRVVLEARRAGLPLVATAVGGIPEQAAHWPPSWLVPPGDPPALARALAAAMRAPRPAAPLPEDGPARFAAMIASYAALLASAMEDLP